MICLSVFFYPPPGYSDTIQILPRDHSYFSSGQPDASPPSQNYKVVFSINTLFTPAEGSYPENPVVSGTTIEARFSLSAQGQTQYFLVTFPSDLAANPQTGGSLKDLSSLCNAKIIGVSQPATSTQVTCIGSVVTLTIPNDQMPGGNGFFGVIVGGWDESTQSSSNAAWLTNNPSKNYCQSPTTSINNYCNANHNSDSSQASIFFMQSDWAQWAPTSTAAGNRDPSIAAISNPVPATNAPKVSGDGKTLTIDMTFSTFAPQPPPPPPPPPGPPPSGCTGSFCECNLLVCVVVLLFFGHLGPFAPPPAPLVPGLPNS